MSRDTLVETPRGKYAIRPREMLLAIQPLILLGLEGGVFAYLEVRARGGAPHGGDAVVVGGLGGIDAGG